MPGPVQQNTSGLAVDECHGLVFISYPDFATGANWVIVSTIANPCVPMQRIQVATCPGVPPLSPITGLAVNGCPGILYATDGINTGNTLFVFTSDEGDHFVGGSPSPPDCDGVTTPCTYSTIGEINTNLAGLLATQQGITTPFRVHSDSAPTFYITGNPSRTAPVTRAFERATLGCAGYYSHRC